jgi:hypothetical protein
MARIFIDGFESGDLTAWDIVGGDTTITTGISGMDGMYCADLFNANNSFLYKALPSKAEYYVAFRWRAHGGYVYGQTAMEFLNETTTIGRLFSSGVNTLTFICGTTSTTTIFDYNSTHLFEIYFKPHDTEGSYIVKCDGSVILSNTGDTTVGASTIDGITMGSHWVNAFQGAVQCYIDNVVIDDSEWPGNTLIQAIFPNDRGYISQWIPEPITSLNYTCVDEIPGDSSDYVKTNTIGKTDLYNMSSLVGEVGTIKCIQPQALIRATGIPAPQNIQLVIRTNGSNFYSSDLQPPYVYKQLNTLYETNPDTDDPWQESEINEIQSGIKSVV